MHHFFEKLVRNGASAAPRNRERRGVEKREEKDQHEARIIFSSKTMRFGARKTARRLGEGMERS
jgi:hypothetical protein